MIVDIAHLEGWIGRTAEAEDVVTPRLVAEYRATFAPHLAAATGTDDAPLALHWCLAPAVAAMSELGRDGHPAKDGPQGGSNRGFLPPVPLPRRMWAGGEVATHAPLRVGDIVIRRSRIEDVSLKEGRSGVLCFVAVRHEYVTERGLAVSERHDIVYREADTPRPAEAPGPKPPPPARTADLSWHVETSPVLLFRYSAMTFNGHRIHYDLPYVTQEEGYAGLVVHGPLQATLLLNVATALAGRPPAIFQYRGVSPMIAGHPMAVEAARRPDGGVSCWTRSAEGRICMDAEASG